MCRASIWSRTQRRFRSRSSFCRAFVINETRQPRPHVVRFVEMPGDALRAPANGKCETAEIGHDGEYRFIGDIVADKKRNTPAKGLVGHQFANPRGLGKAGMLDF